MCSKWVLPRLDELVLNKLEIFAILIQTKFFIEKSGPILIRQTCPNIWSSSVYIWENFRLSIILQWSMQFGYPYLIRLSFSKPSPIQIRFWIAESGWIVIRKPDHVQHWDEHSRDEHWTGLGLYWIRIMTNFVFFYWIRAVKCFIKLRSGRDLDWVNGKELRSFCQWKLYFVNFLNFICTWILNFFIFGLRLYLNWALKTRSGSGPENMTVRSSLELKSYGFSAFLWIWIGLCMFCFTGFHLDLIFLFLTCSQPSILFRDCRLSQVMFAL